MTICAKARRDYFGNIVQGNVILNDIGSIAARYLQKIPRQFPGVTLDEYVVMPNHVHGIFVFNDNFNNTLLHVAQIDINSKANILESLLEWYQICVKRYAILHSIPLSWESRVFQQKIQDKAIYCIRDFIKENPYEWEEDKDNPENLFM